MHRHTIKRETDIQIITDWIEEGQKVLDIGCGRGILLEHLAHSRGIQGIGVDTNLSKVQSCVKRGVCVYHGAAESFLGEFPEGYFDWIVMSRMVQELSNPGVIIRQSLKVSSNVAIGFVNHGYWLNRLSTLVTGSRPTNEVFPLSWEEGSPYNPVTVEGFEKFTVREGIQIEDSVFLRGDWRTRTSFLPNIRSGYALYHLRATQEPDQSSGK